MSTSMDIVSLKVELSGICQPKCSVIKIRMPTKVVNQATKYLREKFVLSLNLVFSSWQDSIPYAGV